MFALVNQVLVLLHIYITKCTQTKDLLLLEWHNYHCGDRIQSNESVYQITWSTHETQMTASQLCFCSRNIERKKLGQFRCWIHFENADGWLRDIQMIFLKAFAFYALDQRTHSWETEIYFFFGSCSCSFFFQSKDSFRKLDFYIGKWAVTSKEYLFPTFF